MYRPCIIWIHGGSWCNHDYNRNYRPNEELIAFAKKGFIIVSIDYRLTDEAPFPAQLEDCKCAVRFLRANAEKYGIDINRIYAWGESAGGHLAALLATVNEDKDTEGYPEYSSRINGVCVWYAPSKLDDLCQNKEYNDLIQCLFQENLHNNTNIERFASPYYHINEKTVPFLVMHGTADNVVPIEQSDKLVEKLKDISKNKVVYIKVEDQGHGFFQGNEYYEQVFDFFNSL